MTRITVIISTGQSNHPAKRRLEEDLVTRLLGERDVEVTIVPHLYDLAPNDSGLVCLAGIDGDMIVCSWLYGRAAHWTLDQAGILGQMGKTLLEEAVEENKTDDHAEASDSTDLRMAGSEQQEKPNRKIYCLDLRTHDSADPYLEEIRRIATECAIRPVQLAEWSGNGSPSDVSGNSDGHPARERLQPTTADEAARRVVNASENGNSGEPPARRWYPVIDYSRCTNCLECIDFCLFGVYGLDASETILVEQPDDCRKGCPACSRVCPESAIIFPQHKAPGIAGSAEAAGLEKIDLSQIFGGGPALLDDSAVAPNEELRTAVAERDEQLRLAGREPAEQASDAPRDELDALVDELDALDL